MAGIFDFLHIKGRTVGSSNELSFDVLEATRNQLDADTKKQRRNNRNTRGSRGSVPGSGVGTNRGFAASRGTPLTSASEVHQRKVRRRNQVLRLRTLGALVLIVVLCFVAFFSHRYYQGRMDFSGRLNEMVAQFVAVDRSLVQIDSLMEEPLNGLWADQRQEALAEAPELQRALTAIIDEAQSLKEDPLPETDPTALDDVIAAAKARQALVTAAVDVFELSAAIGEETAAADGVWVRVVGADEALRRATATANKAETEEQTTEARDLTRDAKEQFENALSELEYLENTIDDLDLSAQKHYLEKRIQAMDYAIETADALLDGHRDQATRANDLYNETERQAAELARELSATPAVAITETYREQMDQAEAAYDDARAQVTAADSALRARVPQFTGD